MNRTWRDRVIELTDRLLAEGGNLKAASKAAGLNETGFRDLREKVTDPRVDTLQKVAAFFRVPLMWLIEGREDGRIPVISWISAGALAQPRTIVDPEDVLGYIHQDFDTRGDWIALRVQGDSMDRISPPESVILVDRKDKRLIANACYVITDGESGDATYKRYRPDPARWEPVSTNAEHEPIYVTEDSKPTVVGRVRRTLLDM